MRAAAGVQPGICEQHQRLEPLRDPQGGSGPRGQPGAGGLSQRHCHQQGQEEAAAQAEGLVGGAGGGAGREPCCGELLCLGGMQTCSSSPHSTTTTKRVTSILKGFNRGAYGNLLKLPPGSPPFQTQHEADCFQESRASSGGYGNLLKLLPCSTSFHTKHKVDCFQGFKNLHLGGTPSCLSSHLVLLHATPNIKETVSSTQEATLPNCMSCCMFHLQAAFTRLEGNCNVSCIGCCCSQL